VEKPKARDRGASSAEERIRYSSSILPKCEFRRKPAGDTDLKPARVPI
jgi:hypothetical protein